MGDGHGTDRRTDKCPAQTRSSSPRGQPSHPAPRGLGYATTSWAPRGEGTGCRALLPANLAHLPAAQPRHVEATRERGREEKWFPYHRLPGADKNSSCYTISTRLTPVQAHSQVTNPLIQIPPRCRSALQIWVTSAGRERAAHPAPTAASANKLHAHGTRTLLGAQHLGPEHPKRGGASAGFQQALCRGQATVCCHQAPEELHT